MKKLIKSSLSHSPYMFIIAQYVFLKYKRIMVNRDSAENIFKHIYESNFWDDMDSVSGSGSNLSETLIIRNKLPKLFKDYNILSILDIPCGDFYWMNEIDLNKIEYTGADIVKKIIDKNKKYEKNNIKFNQIDLINNSLPIVDLIFIRDCLVHLSYDNIFKSLENIYQSGSKYLLTTTFPNKNKNNDIVTGQWRPLNLQIHPFNLPDPQFILNEGHDSYEWKDKSLGLWEISDIYNNNLKSSN